MSQEKVYKFLKRPENIKKFFTTKEIAIAINDKVQLVSKACSRLVLHGEITRKYVGYNKAYYSITKNEIYFRR